MKQDKKAQEFLNEETSLDKMDNTLKEWVGRVMDDEIRTEISNSLKDDFGITRTPKKVFVLKHIRPILATAASIALLVSIVLFNQDNIAPDALAIQYLSAQQLQHPGGSKGTSLPDANRTKAIKAFNEGDFAKAVGDFKKIESPRDEDSYYLGLAYLKTGQYQNAIETLQNCTKESVRFEQETNWFIALSLLMDGKYMDAERKLEQIKQGDWKHDEANELLKSIENHK